MNNVKEVLFFRVYSKLKSKYAKWCVFATYKTKEECLKLLELCSENATYKIEEVYLHPDYRTGVKL